MTKKKALVVLFVCGLLWCCRKTEVPLLPREEDWSFPSDTTKFSVTLYSDRHSVAVDEPFDIKLVFYNVDSVFSAAVEMVYTSDTVQVVDILTGPYLVPESDILAVTRVEPDSNRVSYGVTFKADTTNRMVNGSGVVMKLKCRGGQAGRASISINAQKLEIWKQDGTRIPNFNTLQIENLSIVVQ